MTSVVTMRDVRAAKLCSRGARLFFRDNNLDWGKFLREGMPLAEAEKLEGPFVQKVLEAHRGKQ